jgi:pyruvate/2-oxoglutarate dehydrogenase complex dihydrolipoamide acyltransferase (E2) component
MPHEVIMPALGMAQKTGLIVSWLKQPGDAVKAGEPLMEVETDKAVMEVEAAHDGYLTDVRAAAGDAVPVGDVVALISETADGAGNSGSSASKVEASSASADSTAPAPAGKPVIMPALGMAQDSGRIVAWSKAPGDKVAADDVLFEVETDKATVEVHAGHDGWIAELRGHAGEDIPVGEVIAIISAEKPAAPRHRARSGSASATDGSRDARAAEPAATQSAAPKPEAGAPRAAPKARPAAAPAPSHPVDGRILASPKARRVAEKRGLDLSRLVAAGHPQPFHMADLETLAAMPAQAAMAGVAAGASLRIKAKVRAAALTDLCALAAEEGVPITPARAVAAFATGALRAAAGAASLRIAVETPGRAAESLDDGDRKPLGAPLAATDTAPDLVLRDLSGTRLRAMSPGAAPAPVLTLARRKASLTLTLDFDPARLTMDAAIAFMSDLAGRIEEPLRHLL